MHLFLLRPPPNSKIGGTGKIFTPTAHPEAKVPSIDIVISARMFQANAVSMRMALGGKVGILLRVWIKRIHPFWAYEIGKGASVSGCFVLQRNDIADASVACQVRCGSRPD